MTQKNSPNILFLLTDQQRYDSLSCNGASICRTPAVDEIAAQGTRFTNAYTPIALCSPARGSLLTGLYPHNHGQLSNMGNFNGVFANQILDKPAYPQLLKEAGYQVSCVGKWHLAKEGDSEFWGYDKWHPYREWHQWLRDAGIDFRIDRDAVQPLEWGGDAPFYGRLTLPAERTMEAWTADKTIELIDGYTNAAQPFMIAANFFGPHFPYAVPAPYDTMYEPNDVERWATLTNSLSTSRLSSKRRCSAGTPAISPGLIGRKSSPAIGDSARSSMTRFNASSTALRRTVWRKTLSSFFLLTTATCSAAIAFSTKDSTCMRKRTTFPSSSDGRG